MSILLGMEKTGNSKKLRFSVVNPYKDPLFLQLISLKDGSCREIPFDKKNNTGSVCSMELDRNAISGYGYRLRSGNEVFIDPYAFNVSGDEKWGRFDPVGRFEGETVSYELPRNDEKRAFSDCIIYYLHVRGFTRHKSSGVKAPGTFEGIIEKIPYLKELGINTVELMPCFDFNEVISSRAPRDQREAKDNAGVKTAKKVRLNYWGFTPGNYFVPKNSFSASGDGADSFKKMVKALHEAGIEVIVDFYFDHTLTSRFVTDVLSYWVVKYGIDGFALFGAMIPAKDILRDPYLTDTKLIFERVVDPEGLDYLDEERKKYVAVLNNDFLYDNRRFLKSDADMLQRFSRHLLYEPDKYGLINFMASFNTMTMNDMVSFDRKHNEENGEGNADGTDVNYSWNCGVEGSSRRRAVMTLRERQIKNGFSYLLLSRGTPRIFMGDEFRNSQKGNNNPYCLDNKVSWLDWEDLNRNGGMVSFVKGLIALRLADPVFRSSIEAFEGRYPQVSFHGEMAWKALFHDYFRHLGVMYSGESLYYCAFNMHWREEKLALPKPEKKEAWKLIINTNENGKEPLISEGFIHVPARSVCILRAE